MSGVVLSENGDTPIPDDEDFGLFNPLEYVIETWQAYRQFGILPLVGGYNDQDANLMADWRTLNRRYNLAMHRNKDAGKLDFSGRNAKTLAEF